jgi:hypothetical protein
LITFPAGRGREAQLNLAVGRDPAVVERVLEVAVDGLDLAEDLGVRDVLGRVHARVHDVHDRGIV